MEQKEIKRRQKKVSENKSVKKADIGDSMSANGKIGVCLIGSGRAGLIHAKNFATNIREAEFVAMVDTNQEAAAESCEQLGVSKHYLDY